MAKIVPAESIITTDDNNSNFRRSSRAARTQFPLAITDGRRGTGSNGENVVPGSFDSENLPSVFASEIQRFLRVANLLERKEPRVAYLCRFHAFVISHNLDKNSIGRGVWQFKTALLQRLEQDDEVTIRKRKEMSDFGELKRVYHSHRHYCMIHEKAFDVEQSRREKLMKVIIALNIASVLFEMLKTFTNYYAASHQIKPPIAVVPNVRGLTPPQDFKKQRGLIGLFNFLRHCFGYKYGFKS